MKQKDTKILELISNETKSSIDQLSVVTPSMYASIFSEFALQHNQTIENEEELAHDLMKIECSNLTELQNQASKSVQVLSKNTSKAIHAIKEKDDSILNTILKETEALRYEIEKLTGLQKSQVGHCFNVLLKDSYISKTHYKKNGSYYQRLKDIDFEFKGQPRRKPRRKPLKLFNRFNDDWFKFCFGGRLAK